MLINTAPDKGAGGLAAGSLLKISGSGTYSSVLVCRSQITNQPINLQAESQFDNGFSVGAVPAASCCTAWLTMPSVYQCVCECETTIVKEM